jgi:hypothetical protein
MPLSGKPDLPPSGPGPARADRGLGASGEAAHRAGPGVPTNRAMRSHHAEAFLPDGAWIVSDSARSLRVRKEEGSAASRGWSRRPRTPRKEPSNKEGARRGALQMLAIDSLSRGTVREEP